MIGESLGQYQILEPLGAGGMGEVYRALDSNLKREVAIKLLPPELSCDRERLARLEREARLLAALNHPGIAAIHNLEQAGERRFLVLELVEGETLAEHLERGALPPELALEIGRQIAQALEAAHEAGIIHRDLKPANVKITPDFQVKVLDFGLAKATDAEPGGQILDLSRSPTMMVDDRTGTGVILGTAAYMSPEQARGEELDKRTDIWSFGLLLFEMLSGDSPFAGDTLSETMAGILRDEPDWEQVPAATPRQVRKLLRRCLRKDHAKRLRDIGDARLEIEEALVEPETGDPGTGTAGATRGLAIKLALPALAITALVAGFAGRTTAPVSPAVPSPTIRVEAELTQSVLNRVLGSNVVLSPDGTRAAFVTQPSWGQPTELHIRKLDESRSTRLAVHAQLPFFSPDGQWVAFGYGRPRESAEAAVPERSIRKVSVNGGTPQVVAAMPLQQSLRGGSWGGDGMIVFGTAENGLYRVSAEGGEPRQLLALRDGERSYRWPQLLKGERHVVFTSVAENAVFDASNVEILDLETSERRVLASGATYGRYLPTGHLVYVSGEVLYAVRFDLETLRVGGLPRAVARGVDMFDANGSAQYSFSQSGVLLYRPSTRSRYPVVWVSRQGIKQAHPGIAPGPYADPRLSPDGKRLTMTVREDYDEGQNEIWVYDLERQSGTPVAEYVGGDHTAVWSPDGEHLMFTSERRRRGYLWDMVRARSDGSGRAEQVASHDGQAFRYVREWLEGDRVVFLGDPSAKNVYVADNGGEGEPRLVVDSAPFRVLWTAVSPNGRWLAFASDRSGKPEIYVRAFPEGGRDELVSGADGGSQPRWRADGRELFFRTEEGIMAVQVETEGDTFRAGEAGYLFQGGFRGGLYGIDVLYGDYDVTPDGQRFVMFPGVDEAPGRVVIVTNWFAELERLVVTH